MSHRGDDFAHRGDVVAHLSKCGGSLYSGISGSTV